MSRLHRPLGTLAHGEDPVLLTPDVAGWSWTGLHVLLLRPGAIRWVATGEFEAFVLPLSGSCEVTVDDERFELAGRDSVFTRITDFVYLPRDAQATLSTQDGVEVALPMARCTRRLTPRYGPAEEVPVEVRGAGNATRQVSNFGVPGAWEHADKLNACELITPDGNWSSYPPHKHDDTEPCPVVNEEIYYFRIAGRDGVTPGREGFGLHRTYTEDGAIDEDVAVRAGYPMYYLNVLAGPGKKRSMAFCDDPAHGWVRDTWQNMPVDPRCPVTSAEGRVQP